MKRRIDTRSRGPNRHNELLALVVLQSHPGEQFGAIEAANRLGVRWRPLSFALRRLAERGVVKEELVEVPGAARSKEHTRRYWVEAAFWHPMLPPVYATLPPVYATPRGAAGEGTLWRGRVGRLRAMARRPRGCGPQSVVGEQGRPILA